MSTVTDELLLRIAVEGGAVAAGEVDAFNAKIAETEGATARANRGIGGFGETLKGLGAIFAALGIADAVKQFAGFQSTMERLRTQTGATQHEVAIASKGILGMAASVGTGPQSLATAMYHIESAGFRGKTALDALRIAAEGAKVGGADLTDTTTALTAVLVAGYGKGKNAVQQLRNAMGQLNATVGAGDMTMQDLNDALSTGMLATLKTLGLQVRDAGAALAVLGDNNIRGAAAATRLRMSLMQLVHPSSTAKKALAELGLEPLQLAEDMRKPNGLLTMLEDLQKHLKGLSKTQKASDLAAIFGGGRNSAALLTLLNQMDRLKTKYAQVEKGGKQFNSDWKATTHTLSFAIDKLKALGEVALVKVGGAIYKAGSALVQVLSPALKGANGLASMASSIWDKHKKTILEVAKVWAGALKLAIEGVIALFKNILLPMLNVVLTIFGKFVSAINSVVGAFKNFVNEITGPVSKAIGWLAGAANTVASFLGLSSNVAQGVLPNLQPGAATGLPGNPIYMPGQSTGGGAVPPIIGGRPVAQGGGGPPTVSGPRRAPKTANILVPPTFHRNFDGQVHVELTAHLHNHMDGREVSRGVIRQGLMAQARRGAGGAVLTDAG